MQDDDSQLANSAGSSNNKAVKFSPWLLLVGLGAFAISGYLIFLMFHGFGNKHHVPSQYIKTAGTVISAEPVYTARGDFTPTENSTVVFNDKNGNQHIFIVATNTTKPGDTISVAYNPSNPDSKPINASYKLIIFDYLAVSIMSGFFLLAGCILLVGFISSRSKKYTGNQRVK